MTGRKSLRVSRVSVGVEFSADGGTTFITLREADQEIDIASVNAGALAANRP